MHIMYTARILKNGFLMFCVLKCLGGQLQLLSFQDFRYIQIEEVAIQNGLNDASNDCDEVVVTLHHVSVNPIKNVKSAIRAQRE